MAPGEDYLNGLDGDGEATTTSRLLRTARRGNDVRAGRGCAGFSRLTCGRGSLRISTACWTVVRVNRDLRGVAWLSAKDLVLIRLSRLGRRLKTLRNKCRYCRYTSSSGPLKPCDHTAR
ncbi:hypothetical protein ElyMa_005130800 [Elysia marginata]|uniref:Uncharacterized protein n=1 Tax=Elysia marginata TaxID=1093978 RepID=A0AAV4JM20_9GAST|nr:hypothetical protein ElyMa_005130800 [Elysia marginata]